MLQNKKNIQIEQINQKIQTLPRIWESSSESAMLDLVSAKKSDLSYRTDVNPKSLFVLEGNDPSLLSNWSQLSAYSASQISYDNTTSSATSTNLQDLGDELVQEIDDLQGKLVYNYVVDNTVGLNAITGMAANEYAIQRDTQTVYKYSGTAWEQYDYNKSEVDVLLLNTEDKFEIGRRIAKQYSSELYDVTAYLKGLTYTNVSTEAQLLAAILVEGFVIKLTNNITVASQINFAQKGVLHLNGFTINASVPTVVVNITKAVIISGGTLSHEKLTDTSVEALVKTNTPVNERAILHNLTLKHVEFGVDLNGCWALQNVNFEYNTPFGTATDSHRHIAIKTVLGDCFIDNITFSGIPQVATTRYTNFILADITEWTGNLHIRNVKQSAVGALRQFLNFQTLGVNVTAGKLIVQDCNFNDLNGGIFFLTAGALDKMEYIILTNNEQGGDAIGVFKGLLYFSFTGALGTKAKIIHYNNKTLAGALRADYVSLIPTADTANTGIVARQNTVTINAGQEYAVANKSIVDAFYQDFYRKGEIDVALNELKTSIDGKENISNKVTDLTSPDNTTYITTQGLKDELDLKQGKIYDYTDTDANILLIDATTNNGKTAKATDTLKEYISNGTIWEEVAGGGGSVTSNIYNATNTPAQTLSTGFSGGVIPATNTNSVTITPTIGAYESGSFPQAWTNLSSFPCYVGGIPIAPLESISLLANATDNWECVDKKYEVLNITAHGFTNASHQNKVIVMPGSGDTNWTFADSADLTKVINGKFVLNVIDANKVLVANFGTVTTFTPHNLLPNIAYSYGNATTGGIGNLVDGTTITTGNISSNTLVVYRNDYQFDWYPDKIFYPVITPLPNALQTEAYNKQFALIDGVKLNGLNNILSLPTNTSLKISGLNQSVYGKFSGQTKAIFGQDINYANAAAIPVFGLGGNTNSTNPNANLDIAIKNINSYGNGGSNINFILATNSAGTLFAIPSPVATPNSNFVDAITNISTITSGQIGFQLTPLKAYRHNGTAIELYDFILMGQVNWNGAVFSNLINYAFNRVSTTQWFPVAISNSYPIQHNIGTNAINCTVWCSSSSTGENASIENSSYTFANGAASASHGAIKGGITPTSIIIKTGTDNFNISGLPTINNTQTQAELLASGYYKVFCESTY